MAKIETLDREVYEKIAAGEVVENPYSVVKELVENSIDAGADKIKVELRAGGKELIRVVDNGTGFNENDVEIAFKRHSTSKFRSFSDFDRLSTLGFRGEALPSILEVSVIDLESSDNESGEGVICHFRGGRLTEKEKAPVTKGTSISVKDLFYNFPVRKKFLKGDRSELNRVLSFLETTVLAHFDKTFELIHNGKTLFYYEKVKGLRERVYQVFGKEFSESLISLENTEGEYRVNALVSKLNTGVSSKKYQYFFVNGRSVTERTLYAALNNSFKNFLEKSRSPAAIMLFEIPPAEVDVNIHPMKLEVKFQDPQRIYRFINSSVRSLFPGHDIEESLNRVPEFTRPSPEPFKSGNRQKITAEGFQTPMFVSHDEVPDDFTVIGQYRDSYIIVEKNGDLLVVDQHNADERANFDKLKKDFTEKKIVSVSPLFPLVLDLTPSEVVLFDEKKAEILSESGFEISPLSGNSYDIKKYPEILSERNVKDAVRNIIRSEFQKEGFEDKVLAEIACKSSIKVNYRLHHHQMISVVRKLFNSSNPYFCPHKRPIIVDFSLEKIEKLLKRR